MPKPRGSRPSIAALTRAGERKASDSVMRIERSVFFSRAAISRYKRVIGNTLKSRNDAGRATEVAIAVKSLNRMRDLGQALCSRVA